MNTRITIPQILGMAKYIEAHHHLIRAERPAYSVVAEQVSQELGFKCSSNDVRLVAEASGRAWVPTQALDSSDSDGQNLRLLARAIVEIPDHINVKVDQQIHHIACGRRTACASRG